jgi:hypothetical protein
MNCSSSLARFAHRRPGETLKYPDTTADSPSHLWANRPQGSLSNSSERRSIDAGQLAADPALAQLTPLGAGFYRRRKALVAQAAATLAPLPSRVRRDRRGILSILARAKGLSKPGADAIIHSQEIRMSYAYQEILDEGRAEERAEQQRRMVRMVEAALALKFKEHGLTELLSRCSPEDLEWVQEMILSVETVRELSEQLEARLATPRH